jgi:hypothetical protein
MTAAPAATSPFGVSWIDDPPYCLAGGGNGWVVSSPHAPGPRAGRD